VCVAIRSMLFGQVSSVSFLVELQLMLYVHFADNIFACIICIMIIIIVDSITCCVSPPKYKLPFVQCTAFDILCYYDPL